MLIANFPGLMMLVTGFASAFGVGAIFGTSEEGPLMLVAGPLVALMDLIYRYKRQPESPSWFGPSGGGSLFFLPMWGFGVLWLVLGIVYMTVGEID